MTSSTTALPRPIPAWADPLARWMARIVVVAGLWCFAAIPLDLLAPRFVHVISSVFGVLNVPVAANVFTGALLLLIGSALAVRKRAALWFVIVVFQIGWLLVAALVTVLRAWDLDRFPKVLLDSKVEVALFAVEIATALVFIPLLWAMRPAFPARIAPGAFREALLHLAAGLALSASVGLVLTELFPHTLEGQRRRILWPIRTALGFMPDVDSPAYAGTGHRWVAAVIGALSTIALLWAWHVLLRSGRLQRMASDDDELTVRALLAEFGEGDSLGYFATRRDKAIAFAPNRRAAIAYRVEAGVSLASGDPVGDPAAWPAAIETWMAEAQEFGWALGALSVSDDGAAAYAAAGLRAMRMGDEAILEVRDFRLGGHAMRPVRQAVNRVRRAGYELQVRRHGEVDPAELAEVRTCAERWRGDADERGFSMALGRLGDPADERCVLVTAHDANGTLRAVLSLVPWGRGGLSLDLMRRDRDGENGLIEFMVAGLVDASRRLGVRRISLNFAMFREVFSARERVGAGPVVRLQAGVLGFASRFWQIESLYRSNAKYQPVWRPRYLCFGATLQANRALLAAGIAEGFIPNPLDRHSMVQAPSSPELVAAIRELRVEPSLPERRPSRVSAVRMDKLDELRRHGASPYPVRVPRTDDLAAIRARYAGLPASTRTGQQVSVTGRIVRRRSHGRLCFAVLREGDAELQVLVSQHGVGAEAFDLWCRSVDVGDHVSCTGEVMVTDSGELSVDASAWTMAAKCLRPLPSMRQPLPAETRVRHRHLDLITDPSAAAILRTRGLVLRAIRDALHERDFLEVETPMLHPIQGGASARPFRTRINAYHMDLYLRIAPELYLKRLCVGGIDRLYELNRNFRNEGADATHNPEFTSLEVYQAHADYADMRALAQALVVRCALAVHGTADLERQTPDGTRAIDLAAPWPVIRVHDAVSRAVGVPIDTHTSVDDLHDLCQLHHVTVPFGASAGALVEALYGELVEPVTVEPTFFIDFPLDTSPLARAHRDDPLLAERWDLVAFGMELGTAYSELNDPVDQRARLTAQSLLASAGDHEAMRLDEDFLDALEYAMPPTGGLGLGIDRLVMLLTGRTIRGTLAFPFVRPQASAGAAWHPDGVAQPVE